MPRLLWITLFLIVLVLPFVMRRTISHPSTSLPAPSRDAARTLVIITPHNQDIRREFARAFQAWHTQRFGERVEIDYRVPGGTQDIKRQLDDTYGSWRATGGALDPKFVPDIHAVFGGGNYFLDVELRDILQPMHIDSRVLAETYPEPSLAGVRLYDATVDAAGASTPKWVGVCLSAYGIVYNPDIFRGLGIDPPTTWRDLTDTRLAGQLALADPTHSGSAGIAYMMVIERRMADAEAALLERRPDLRTVSPGQRWNDAEYRAAVAAGWKKGMSELLRIAANARYFVDSSPQVPSDVANGDAAAGVAIDFYGRVYQGVVGPERCRVVMPAGATAITPDPVGILQGVRGTDLELARRFVDFLLTREGQLIWILRPGEPGGPAERPLRRPPVRRDLYADRSRWTDDVDLFAQAQGFNQRTDFERSFSETRAVWTAAWIDTRESLKSAYDAILRVPDASRRDELLAKLADLPITMEEVEAFRVERKRIQSLQQSAEQHKARHRIALVNEFRDHYRSVEHAARFSK